MWGRDAGGKGWRKRLGSGAGVGGSKRQLNRPVRPQHMAAIAPARMVPAAAAGSAGPIGPGSTWPCLGRRRRSVKLAAAASLLRPELPRRRACLVVLELFGPGQEQPDGLRSSLVASVCAGPGRHGPCPVRLWLGMAIHMRLHPAAGEGAVLCRCGCRGCRCCAGCRDRGPFPAGRRSPPRRRIRVGPPDPALGLMGPWRLGGRAGPVWDYRPPGLRIGHAMVVIACSRALGLRRADRSGGGGGGGARAG